MAHPVDSNIARVTISGTDAGFRGFHDDGAAHRPVSHDSYFCMFDVIVRPLSTVGYTSVVASVIHSRQ